MPIFKFKNPLRTSGSNGFQTSITDQDGNVSTINVFSIGQDVGTDSNVEFDGVSQPEAQTAIIGTDANNMVLGYQFISGSNLTFTTDEQGLSENYTHEERKKLIKFYMEKISQNEKTKYVKNEIGIRGDVFFFLNLQLIKILGRI